MEDFQGEENKFMKQQKLFLNLKSKPMVQFHVLHLGSLKITQTPFPRAISNSISTKYTVERRN